MNPVDQWLAINAKYFPTEQVQYIRQRLEALPEQQLSMLYSISFQDPTMMLVISLLGGTLGIDRFILGQVGLGVGKLLTCGGCGIWSIVDWFLIMDATRQSNAKNSLQLLANEKTISHACGPTTSVFRLYLLVLVAVYGVYLFTSANTTQFNPKTIWP